LRRYPVWGAIAANRTLTVLAHDMLSLLMAPLSLSAVHLPNDGKSELRAAVFQSNE